MNSFDLLPTDVKLHVFTFLNKTKDVVALTATNRANHTLNKLPKLWQQRALKDFGITIPASENAKELYLELDQEYQDEYRAANLLWVIGAFANSETAANNPIRRLFDPPHINTDAFLQDSIRLIRHLIIYSHTIFIKQAERTLASHLVSPNKQFDVNLIYRAFAQADIEETLYNEELLTNELYAYSDSDARLHLAELLRLAPKSSLVKIARDPEHGSSLFHIALRFGNVEMISALLNLGMNACEIRPRHRSNFYRPLDAVMNDLRSCTGIMTRIVARIENNEVDYLVKYYLLRIDCFKQICLALLQHQANPDSLSQHNNIRMESPRSLSTSLRQEVALKSASWCPEEIAEDRLAPIDAMLAAATTVLQLIEQAPALQNTAGREPLNKRQRV